MSRLSRASAWSLAWRDLNGGFRGLRLLFLCILLGVGTLATIGSLTRSITAEISTRGQTLLGGDVEVAVSQREASAQELALLQNAGRVSTTIRMRAMANALAPATSGAQSSPPSSTTAPAAVLSELKAVDAAYPLYGRLTLANGRTAPPPTAETVLIGRALADRLLVKPGESLRFGNASFRVTGIIGEEPDRVGEGFTLGPVAITSLEGMRRTALIQPGSLYSVKYRLRLERPAQAHAISERLKRQLSTAGVEVKDRDGAAPGANRFIDRMGQFLSLIGLAALVIAGIGVSNGVTSYLAAKRSGIATYKILGASSADILRIYASQVAIVALAAILLGLVAGVLVPPLIVLAAGNALPVTPGLSIQPLPLAIAALYGALIAALFTIAPLAAARTTPAASLLRSRIEGNARWELRSIGWMGLVTAAILTLALSTSDEPLFAAAILGATGGVLLLLLGLGWLLRRLVHHLPRPRQPLVRLAMANLHRPGSQTPTLVVALGLALTLFVTLAAIQTSLSAEIRRTVPARAPDAFVLDVPMESADAFRADVLRAAPGATIAMVPALRGTITQYGSTRVADLPQLPDGAWFLRGERGVTYADSLPPGSELLAGQWWPRDYSGPPLVSIDKDAADVMGVGVGDMLTVSVLGREIPARIASLRRVNWDTMGFNYILVFSPHTLATAPHTLAATITMEDAQAGAVARNLLAHFPSVSIIAVKDVVTQVTGLLDQMASAILAAASVTILAGIVVLVGAIAASRQARAYDTIIMKVLGATRRQILLAQMIEYGLLAAALALVALVLGGGAGWFVITRVFAFHWLPDWPVIGATLAGGAVLTLGIGLIGSLPLMAERPAKALRSL